MLASVFVFSIPLAWLLNCQRTARNEEQVLQSFPNSSSYYQYQVDSNHDFVGGTLPGPVWLRKIFGSTLFARVHTLEIELSDLDHFDRVLDLRSLKGLKLPTSYKPPKKIDGLQTLQLESLEVGLGSAEINSLQFLTEMTSLFRLRIDSDNLSIRDLDDLQKLTNLKELSLWRLADIKNLDGLSNLHQLESLSLRGNSVGSLEGIEMLTRLKELTLTFDQGAIDLVSLAELKELRTLNLRGRASLTNTQTIGQLSKLERLELGRGFEDTDSTSLRDLGQLTYLELRSCPKLVSLSGFDGLSNLAHFKAISLGANLDISGIQDCNKLPQLVLKCESVKSVKAFLLMPNLKQISYKSHCFTKEQEEQLSQKGRFHGRNMIQF